MHLKRVALMTAAVVSIGFANMGGEKLLEKHCTSCHMASNPTAEKVKHMVAPPMWGIVRHLKKRLKGKEEYIAFVSSYIMSPSKENARFTKEAIARFGLMPSMKGTITEKEARIIAEYLYNTY
ncbi:c-type cytochrome [Hydrogenimonas sp.]